MERVTPRTLSGFMELLPSDQLRMERLLDALRRSYELYGFAPLDTPTIEAAEVLLAKGGGETEKQIYRFTKGDADLALRFDLTVPLARYVAQHYAELAFPFRRYQIGKVWRGERAQRGRFREFIQADIDIIGDGSLDIMNEAEVPAIIYKSLSALGLRRFRIRVNNRRLLGGFFELLGLPEKAADIMRLVDKLEKIGAEKLSALLAEEGLNAEQISRLLEFISLRGTTAERLSYLDTMRGESELFDTGLEELKTVAGCLAAFGVPEDAFEIDLSIARGLDYYTGTVYETQLLDYPEIGSVCSGGRYDDLAGFYTDKKLPGVGVSIGVTRLFYVLREQGLLTEDGGAPADVLVIPMTDSPAAAIETATALRGAGLRAQLYTEKKKFKARMSYANKLGVPYVVLLGEDELAAGKLSLKNMENGSQSLVSIDEAIAEIGANAAARCSLPVIAAK